MIDLGGDVTGNGISKLVFTILSAVAEAERDRIRERIADVKRDQKTRGRFLGGSRPFGCQIGADGSLEPLESERKPLLAMRRMQREARACAPSRSRCRNADFQSRTKASRRP
jgi:putative DNA-invertase from lambdoid prophage Rac